MTERYGLVIDLDRCTGCQTCAIACKMEHGLEGISGIRVETVGGPDRDTPKGHYPALTMYYLPIPCMHCKEPACLPACPSGAIYQRRDGIVIIDEEKCDGCEQCLEACPYGAPAYDARKNIAWKCTLCAHRLDQGLEPFCVLCCEMEAMFFGPVDDPAGHISQLVEQKKAFVLRSETGTGPAVRYIPARTRQD